MAKFPESEATITQLAETLKGGLASDPVFSDAPATPAQIQSELSELAAANTTKINADAAAKTATIAKNDGLNALIDSMKQVFSWAVKIPGITAEQLQTLGWGFPDPPRELKPPAQCGNFRLHNIEGQTVDFDWDKPSYKDGGKPTGYKIYRREAGTSAPWLLCNALFGAMSLEDIEPFPTGQWEVGVRASNAAGEGPLSNTVAVAVG